MSLKLAAKPKVKKQKSGPGKELDLVIIGGGPAGLTAAIYALRARLKVLLIEKLVLGGLASTSQWIENYPGFPEGLSGLELAQKISEQAQKLGLEVCWDTVTQIKPTKPGFSVIGETGNFSARAVIVASGTEPLKLNVPGEAEFVGRGVSYCATCDGPFYQNKNILVVGGGNAAIEEALFLTRFASKVSIVHRRDQLRADPILAERAQSHPKIYFFWHSVIAKISGEKTVTSVTLKDLHANQQLQVPADGVFIYVGSQPNGQLVKELVKCDEHGFIITDDKLQTSLPGIFAAGDIRVKGLRQVITAAADGAQAATAVLNYLENLDRNNR